MLFVTNAFSLNMIEENLAGGDFDIRVSPIAKQNASAELMQLVRECDGITGSFQNAAMAGVAASLCPTMEWYAGVAKIDLMQGDSLFLIQYNGERVKAGDKISLMHPGLRFFLIEVVAA